MNLRQPNANEATGTANRSRNVVPLSGMCTRCVDGCKGSCEIWLASFRGREVLYPIEFGEMTAGADKNYPVDYSHLSIQGYAVGAKGLPKGVKGGPDTALFPEVNTEIEYGWNKKVKMRLPIFTGALGSTEIARRNWEHAGWHIEESQTVDVSQSMGLADGGCLLSVAPDSLVLPRASIAFSTSTASALVTSLGGTACTALTAVSLASQSV